MCKDWNLKGFVVKMSKFGLQMFVSCQLFWARSKKVTMLPHFKNNLYFKVRSFHFLSTWWTFVRCIPTYFGAGVSVNIFVNLHHHHLLTILHLLQKYNKKLYSTWLIANIFCETREQNLFTFQRSSIRQAKDTKQSVDWIEHVATLTGYCQRGK